MKKTLCIIIFILFVVISCASFPIYNFGEHYTYALSGVSLYLNLICYIELGVFEKKILFSCKLWQVAMLNFGIVLIGMLCRYFLEYGEVSNLYNFTIPNVLLHVFATYSLSMVSYLLSKRHT